MKPPVLAPTSTAVSPATSSAKSSSAAASFNQRLLETGGQIYLSRDIEVHYYPRDSFATLAKQYWKYGRGRARTVRTSGPPKRSYSATSMPPASEPSGERSTMTLRAPKPRGEVRGLP